MPFGFDPAAQARVERAVAAALSGGIANFRTPFHFRTPFAFGNERALLGSTFLRLPHWVAQVTMAS